MSGRQPRLFGMNRYNVIQSFTVKEKEKLLASGRRLLVEKIGDPAVDAKLREILKKMEEDEKKKKGCLAKMCNCCREWTCYT
tara:strand:+ start:2541 stop:2786 length:246 start_codon:yes stop_codon:yes gene_type:complete